jgi:hypothetical protein
MSKGRKSLTPDVTDRTTLEPDPQGMFQAVSRIGYQIQESLADLIDNSIDAEATKVLIRFFRDGDRLTDLAVVDNGNGMTSAELQEAMRFGSKNKKGSSELGKYGMGLKSASFNQANTLVVVSKKASTVSGRQWTVESIKDGWKLEKLDQAWTTGLINRDWGPVDTSEKGTVVLWERIHRFQAADTANKTFTVLQKTMNQHLGLVFHRFLLDGRLEIYMDLQDISGFTGVRMKVVPLNPFPKKSGDKRYPADFHSQLGTHGDLDFRAYIWPPNTPDPEYKLGGNVSQRQGFYFFRNDRLIQAGGWNGWRNDAEPHSSLARVEINLPPEFDDAFAISVQKNGVDAPPGFISAVEAARAGRSTLNQYTRDAVELYRTSAAQKEKPVAIISTGLRLRLKKQINHRILAQNPNAQPIGIRIDWSAGLDEDEVVRIDYANRTVQLNQKYRSTILNGGNSSSGDAPVFKTLIYLLLREDVLRAKSTKQLEERSELINTLLLAAIADA